MQTLVNVRFSTWSFRQSLQAFFKKIVTRINNLFRPEEVEVTFKVEGKNITYTYTKVDQKHVG